jgi:hypothetical protein
MVIMAVARSPTVALAQSRSTSVRDANCAHRLPVAELTGRNRVVSSGGPVAKNLYCLGGPEFLIVGEVGDLIMGRIAGRVTGISVTSVIMPNPLG